MKTAWVYFWFASGLVGLGLAIAYHSPDFLIVSGVAVLMIAYNCCLAWKGVVR